MTPPLPGPARPAYQGDLVAAFRQWLAVAAPDGDGQPLTAGVKTWSAEQQVTAPLTAAQALELTRVLNVAAFDADARHDRGARTAKIADLVASAAYRDWPVGDMLAAALHAAAGRLYRPWYLIRGRPGSWEATIVERMASTHPASADPRAAETVNGLAALFVQMGEASDDGGDILSAALGAAADRVGSVRRLVDLSGPWADDVDNLAGQYASDRARADGGGSPFGRW